MSKQVNLVGTVVDSSGVTVSVSGLVTVYDLPKGSFSGLPASVATGATVSGKLVPVTDAALTVKSLSVTVDGVAVTVAADGTFSFTA